MVSVFTFGTGSLGSNLGEVRTQRAISRVKTLTTIPRWLHGSLARSSNFVSDLVKWRKSWVRTQKKSSKSLSFDDKCSHLFLKAYGTGSPDARFMQLFRDRFALLNRVMIGAQMSRRQKRNPPLSLGLFQTFKWMLKIVLQLQRQAKRCADFVKQQSGRASQKS